MHTEKKCCFSLLERITARYILAGKSFELDKNNITDEGEASAANRPDSAIKTK
jgi:hypothetical protein